MEGPCSESAVYAEATGCRRNISDLNALKTPDHYLDYIGPCETPESRSSIVSDLCLQLSCITNSWERFKRFGGDIELFDGMDLSDIADKFEELNTYLKILQSLRQHLGDQAQADQAQAEQAARSRHVLQRKVSNVAPRFT
jgi:hypothetical protein